MKQTLIGVLATIAVVFTVTVFVPWARGAVNEYDHTLQKIDDSTLYETRKQVEDTCRATIASYQSDVLTYEQYKDSDDPEQRSWAASAKIRANKAAIIYNEYIMKNSYVFDGNIPDDIESELPIITEEDN